jgi:ATP-dependent DNA helicase RecG
LEIESPGGFPPGITPENILYKQLPRNRRIAEAFSKCGLVERAGQGVNLMFEQCIRENKPTPDYGRSDDYAVNLRLDGRIQDPRFLRFMERIGEERVASFTTNDLLTLDCIHKERLIPEPLKPHVQGLLDLGVIERFGKGRGVRYILSGGLYEFLGKPGVHTRKRGLDRETNKELLVKHIEKRCESGSPLSELRQVLPALTPAQVQGLLRELRREGRVHSAGQTKAGRWYPGPVTEDTRDTGN